MSGEKKTGKRLRETLMRPLMCLVIGLAGSAVLAQGEPDDGDRIEQIGGVNVSTTELNLSGAEIKVETIGSDTVILSGNAEDLAALQAFIEMLDAEIPAKGMEMVILEKRDAKEVARALQQAVNAMTDIGQDRRPEDRVDIIAASSSILLISAPETRMEQIVRIAKALDAAPDTIPDKEPMVFKVKNRKAAEAATKLKEVIDRLRASQGQRPGDYDILPNDANNTILVIGVETSQRDLIQQLLDAIDVEVAEDYGALKLVMFPLLNADATKLGNVITDMMVTPEGRGGVSDTIRKLTMLRKGPDGSIEESAPLDLEKPLRIIADPGTNSLIVATVEGNIEPIGEIIRLLDDVPSAVELGLQIFPLEYADAQSVADLLEKMFKEGKKLTDTPADGPKGAVAEGPIGEALAYEFNVSADPRTNILFVAGRPAQVAVAQSLVAELDVPANTLKFPMQLLFLGENLDATRVSEIVRQLFDQRLQALQQRNAGPSAIEREQIFLAVDIRSNSLILAASKENYEEIAEMCRELDVAPDALIDQIRIINCTNTSAADLDSKIEQLWERRAQLRGPGGQSLDRPVIIADQRSNSLVIASSPEDYQEIKRLVETLEAQPLSPIAGIRLLTLEHNDAKQVGDMLQSLFDERMQQRLAKGQEENPSDRIATAIDPLTNTILVASSQENFDEMTRLVSVLDVEPDLGGIVQTFYLKFAQANNVAEKLDELFGKELYDPTIAESDVAERQRHVAIVADPRANAIIASASRSNLSLIEQLIAQMDSEDILMHEDTKLFPLEWANALVLAEKLDQLFAGMKQNAPEPDLVIPPTIIPDERSNTLIVSGTRDALRRVEDLVGRMDREAGPNILEFQVYPLQFGSAVKLAPKMQEMFDQRSQGGGGGVDTPINIDADEGSNTLICSASRDDHILVAELLTLLDRPSTIAKQFRIFPLAKAKAESMAERLESLFAAQGGGGSDTALGIAIEPEPRTNCLIVWAPSTDMDNIAEIVSQLDSAKPAIEMTVRIIQLRKALAEDFAAMLEATINGGAGGGGGGDDSQAVILTFMQTLDDGTRVERKLIRQDITITPDPYTNSLMVMAPSESMDMLEAMILDFDKVGPIAAEIRMFPLANADAEEMVEQLQELFGDSSGGDGDLERELIFGDGGATLSLGGEGGTRQELRFSADRRTNTVIAAGNEVDLRMVESLIRQLDAEEIEERLSFVYKTDYLDAQEIADAIEQFMQEEEDRFGEIEEEMSMMRQAERKLTVVPVGTENPDSLIIGTSPRYAEQHMDIIYQLDRPQPQVMISALIAEVTLNDTTDLGMEFAVQDLHFSDNAVLGPNGILEGKDYDIVIGTDLGTGSIGGGLSLAFTGEDFSLIWRTLQITSQIEVLSRPTIMVRNGESADIVIADRVPTVSGSQINPQGSLSSQVVYNDIGIILHVEPTINPDGYVSMLVEPEISAQTNTSIQLTEGLSAPIFQERAASTVVTIKDGETVVIGGLITDRREESEAKVPILGDLPWIGYLFKTTRVSTIKTELLIILTVDVIWTEEDAYAMSVKHRDMGNLKPWQKRHPLMEGLRILPEENGFGPRDESTSPPYPQSQPAHEPRDRSLYGPKPGTYGPTLPTGSRISRASGATYGPIVVADKKRGH